MQTMKLGQYLESASTLAGTDSWKLSQTMSRTIRHALLAACIVVAPGAHADCDPYVHAGGIGGDYNNPEDRAGVAIVEQFHFKPQVEKLEHGMSGTLGGDIGYTLEHFPNHPRALVSMARLGLRDKTDHPSGARYSVDCYFTRAIQYKPMDANIKVVYAGYLLAKNQLDEALAQLSEASRLEPDNAGTNYNLGLLYLKKKNYEQARLHAKKAYDKGFPLPGLKNKLVAARQWDDAN